MENSAEKSSEMIMDDYKMDLRQLLIYLWSKKVIIFTITAVTTIAALFFAFIATPYYKTEATLLTASEAQLEKINSFNLIKLTQKDNAAQIYSAITSRDYLFKFFFENKDKFSRYFANGRSENEAFGYFLEDAFSISLPDEKIDQGKGGFIKISAVWPEDLNAQSLLSEFIVYALKSEQKEIVSGMKDLIKVKIEDAERQIAALKIELEEIQANRIKELEEAKSVAERLKIAEPVSVAAMSGSSTGTRPQTLVSISGDKKNPLYLLGYRFLASEIEALKNRKDVTIADERVPKLKAEIEKLRQVDLSQLSIGSVKDEVFIARVASSPYTYPNKVKPKRAIIVVVGGILGIFIGCFFVLVRRFFV